MSLDLSELAVGPQLIERLQEDRGGVDFLNLRQVNLDLMGACIPGQNNVTANVRSYSVMCWVYWKLFQEIERRGTSRFPAQQIRFFREKVESFFLWGHLLNDVRGVAGTRSRPPSGGRGRVSLKFDDWNRSPDNTSIQAAVRYGPSLTELGLLERGNSSFHVTENGERLAKALDARLKLSAAYKTLSDLDSYSGTEVEAQALFPYWRCDETSAAEKQAMQSVLFDATRTDDTRSAIGRRSAFVESIVHVIRANRRPLTLEEIRDGLAYRRTTTKRPIPLAAAAQEVTHYWFVLQMRQLQRLSLEVAMGWMEERLLLSRTGLRMPEIVAAAVDLIVRDFRMPTAAPLSQLARKSSRKIPTEADFFRALDEDPKHHDLQSTASRILDLCADSMDAAFAESIRALGLLWNCHSWLSADPRYQKLIRRGGALRISLQHWFDVAGRFESAPLQEFFAHFFESLIFSQHLAVATNRFDGRNSRLRFALGETGIESLVDEPWRPGISFDHLQAFLMLLDSAGALSRDSNGRFAVELN